MKNCGFEAWQLAVQLLHQMESAALEEDVQCFEAAALALAATPHRGLETLLTFQRLSLRELKGTKTRAKAARRAAIGARLRLL